MPLDRGRRGSLTLLVPPTDGGPGRAKLQLPFPRLARGHPGIPSPPHHFEHGGGFYDMELGDDSRGGGVRNRRFQKVRPVACSVFLRR